MSASDERFAQEVVNRVKQQMFGLDEVIQLCLIGLFTEGHVLLEGNPGLGKTDLVKTLAETLELPWNRIQFTPDLMPSDVTGTYMRDHSAGGEWRFRPGRVFTSLLLADEINRATPKTQSAMLEVMAERQVTPPGDVRSYFLDGTPIPTKRDERNARPLVQPFMVLATQNPIDHEGTYTLPEAQIDRFMFKVLMPMPDRETLTAIIKKRSSPESVPANTQRLEIDYPQRRDRIRAMEATDSLEQHIVNLIHASNGQEGELRFEARFGDEQKRGLEPLMKLFEFGFGPRAAFMLMLGAKGWFTFFYRMASGSTAPPNKAGIADLSAIALPTLRHRLHLKFEWQEEYRKTLEEKKRPDLEGRLRDEVLRERLISDLCSYSAPRREQREQVRIDLTTRLGIRR